MFQRGRTRVAARPSRSVDDSNAGGAPAAPPQPAHDDVAARWRAWRSRWARLPSSFTLQKAGMLRSLMRLLSVEGSMHTHAAEACLCVIPFAQTLSLHALHDMCHAPSPASDAPAVSADADKLGSMQYAHVLTHAILSQALALMLSASAANRDATAASAVGDVAQRMVATQRQAVRDMVLASGLPRLYSAVVHKLCVEVMQRRNYFLPCAIAAATAKLGASVHATPECVAAMELTVQRVTCLTAFAHFFTQLAAAAPHLLLVLLELNVVANLAEGVRALQAAPAAPAENIHVLLWTSPMAVAASSVTDARIAGTWAQMRTEFSNAMHDLRGAVQRMVRKSGMPASMAASQRVTPLDGAHEVARDAENAEHGVEGAAALVAQLCDGLQNVAQLLPRHEQATTLPIGESPPGLTDGALPYDAEAPQLAFTSATDGGGGAAGGSAGSSCSSAARTTPEHALSASADASSSTGAASRGGSAEPTLGHKRLVPTRSMRLAITAIDLPFVAPTSVGGDHHPGSSSSGGGAQTEPLYPQQSQRTRGPSPGSSPGQKLGTGTAFPKPLVLLSSPTRMPTLERRGNSFWLPVASTVPVARRMSHPMHASSPKASQAVALAVQSSVTGTPLAAGVARARHVRISDSQDWPQDRAPSSESRPEADAAHATADAATPTDAAPVSPAAVSDAGAGEHDAHGVLAAADGHSSATLDSYAAVIMNSTSTSASLLGMRAQLFDTTTSAHAHALQVLRDKRAADAAYEARAAQRGLAQRTTSLWIPKAPASAPAPDDSTSSAVRSGGLSARSQSMRVHVSARLSSPVVPQLPLAAAHVASGTDEAIGLAPHATSPTGAHSGWFSARQQAGSVADSRSVVSDVDDEGDSAADVRALFKTHVQAARPSDDDDARGTHAAASAAASSAEAAAGVPEQEDWGTTPASRGDAAHRKFVWHVAGNMYDLHHLRAMRELLGTPVEGDDALREAAQGGSAASTDAARVGDDTIDYEVDDDHTDATSEASLGDGEEGGGALRAEADSRAARAVPSIVPAIGLHALRQRLQDMASPDACISAADAFRPTALTPVREAPAAAQARGSPRLDNALVAYQPPTARRQFTSHGSAAIMSLRNSMDHYLASEVASAEGAAPVTTASQRAAVGGGGGSDSAEPTPPRVNACGGRPAAGDASPSAKQEKMPVSARSAASHEVSAVVAAAAAAGAAASSSEHAAQARVNLTTTCESSASSYSAASVQDVRVQGVEGVDGPTCSATAARGAASEEREEGAAGEQFVFISNMFSLDYKPQMEALIASSIPSLARRPYRFIDETGCPHETYPLSPLPTPPLEAAAAAAAHARERERPGWGQPAHSSPSRQQARKANAYQQARGMMVAPPGRLLHAARPGSEGAHVGTLFASNPAWEARASPIPPAARPGRDALAPAQRVAALYSWLTLAARIESERRHRARLQPLLEGVDFEAAPRCQEHVLGFGGGDEAPHAAAAGGEAQVVVVPPEWVTGTHLVNAELQQRITQGTTLIRPSGVPVPLGIRVVPIFAPPDASPHAQPPPSAHAPPGGSRLRAGTASSLRRAARPVSSLLQRAGRQYRVKGSGAARASSRAGRASSGGGGGGGGLDSARDAGGTPRDLRRGGALSKHADADSFRVRAEVRDEWAERVVSVSPRVVMLADEALHALVPSVRQVRVPPNITFLPTSITAPASPRAGGGGHAPAGAAAPPASASGGGLLTPAAPAERAGAARQASRAHVLGHRTLRRQAEFAVCLIEQVEARPGGA